MSNRLTIEPTEFLNVRSGTKTAGVRVYDDYDQAYLNTWDEIPDDDMEVLKRVIEFGASDIEDMFDHVRVNKKGVYVGGNWYEWDEIKDLFIDD